MFGLGQSSKNFDALLRRVDILENVTGNFGPRMATQEYMMRDVVKALSTLESKLNTMQQD